MPQQLADWLILHCNELSVRAAALIIYGGMSAFWWPLFLSGI